MPIIYHKDVVTFFPYKYQNNWMFCHEIILVLICIMPYFQRVFMAACIVLTKSQHFSSGIFIQSLLIPVVFRCLRVGFMGACGVVYVKVHLKWIKLAGRIKFTNLSLYLFCRRKIEPQVPKNSNFCYARSRRLKSTWTKMLPFSCGHFTTQQNQQMCAKKIKTTTNSPSLSSTQCVSSVLLQCSVCT